MSPKGNVYLFEEVLKHNRLKDCWLIIAGKVYDVTQFMKEHPGGDDILLASTGKDVTKDFEDTGHSVEAREMMETLCIGEIDETTLPEQKRYFIPLRQQTSSQDKAPQLMIKILQYLVPLFILGLAFAIRNYTKDK